MRLALALALSLLAGPSLALAGDPCPIDTDLYDLGVPHWLDRDQVLGGLKSKEVWVGISFSDTKLGLRVHRVFAGGPAATAGLQVDDIITHADGVVAPDKAMFTRHLDRETTGDILKLTVKRGPQSLALPIRLGYSDPLVRALGRHAAGLDCSDVKYAKFDAARAEALRDAVFEPKNRRFRCKDAHKALTAKKMNPEALVFVRGSKRVLIAKPGWATACVRADRYDGERLTPKAVKALFDTLAKGFFDDRFANP